MTVIGLAQSNVIKSKSSVYREKTCCKNKANKFLAIALIFVIGLSVFFYLFQVNNISTKDYKIREIKKQASEIENRNKILQVSVSSLKSINGLQIKTQDFDMVAAQEIEYVNLSAVNGVAIK
ncbi:hypothetical protein KJ684_01850 [Patescibacteria group bacterium]|nr:hypothetical protein [Patescibacteria group bacterium]